MAATGELTTELGYRTRVVGPDTLERQPLIGPDREFERTVMRDHFVARYGLERATSLRAMLEEEPPDLVGDEVDVGAIIAAEAMSVPCITVNVIAAGLLSSPVVIGEAWNTVRELNGLGSDPDCERRAGDMMISAIGPQIDPAEFTRVPPNVTIERCRPQAEILGECAAVIAHGGSGTLLAALAPGVPVVVLPLGADQLDNADRVVDLGVGVVLDPVSASPTEIAAAAQDVIASDHYLQRAALLSAEAHAQPALDDVDQLVALLQL